MAERNHGCQLYNQLPATKRTALKSLGDSSLRCIDIHTLTTTITHRSMETVTTQQRSKIMDLCEVVCYPKSTFTKTILLPTR